MNMDIKRKPLASPTRQIARDFRRSIVRGALGPGSRLPTREEVRRTSGASPLTVQRAFDRLLKDGFIVTRGRDGTFVADRPPHLHQYALVYAGISRNVSTYLDLIAKCIQRAAGPENAVRIYDDVIPKSTCKAYRALRSEVSRQRLAGIIFAYEPHALADTPLLRREFSIPRVAIMPNSSFDLFPTIYPDHRTLIDLGLDALKARGRRKVAVISTIAQYPDLNAHLTQALTERGMYTPERWVVPVAPLALNTVAAAVRLLFHAGQHERPDGLLLIDNHHVEPALSALLAERVCIPADVEVVAHENFPIDTVPSLPVARVGFDISQLATRCFELLRNQREGRPCASFEYFPAMPFESARHLTPTGTPLRGAGV